MGGWGQEALPQAARHPWACCAVPLPVALVWSVTARVEEIVFWGLCRMEFLWFISFNKEQDTTRRWSSLCTLCMCCSFSHSLFLTEKNYLRGRERVRTRTGQLPSVGLFSSCPKQVVSPGNPVQVLAPPTWKECRKACFPGKLELGVQWGLEPSTSVWGVSTSSSVLAAYSNAQPVLSAGRPVIALLVSRMAGIVGPTFLHFCHYVCLAFQATGLWHVHDHWRFPFQILWGGPWKSGEIRFSSWWWKCKLAWPLSNVLQFFLLSGCVFFLTFLGSMCLYIKDYPTNFDFKSYNCFMEEHIGTDT